MNTDWISEFEKYLKKDLCPAVGELSGIDSDKNRIHIQKLLYTDLVNRFDYMMDKMILDNNAEIKGWWHSEKLISLLNFFQKKDIDELMNEFHVDPLTGDIVKGELKQSEGRRRPSGIVEYAVWLHSRRNGIVHGDGVRLTDSDMNKIGKYHNFDPQASFKISISSITVASNFYIQVCALIKG